MSQTRPVESVKSLAAETANWFTRGRAVGVAAIALTLAGAGYVAEALKTDRQDVRAAIPFIKADGFSPGDVAETIGGGTIDIMPLRIGKCPIYGADAHLTYHDGKVADVDNYAIPAINDGKLTVQDTIVIVQNAAELRQKLPGLRC